MFAISEQMCYNDGDKAVQRQKTPLSQQKRLIKGCVFFETYQPDTKENL